MVSRREFLGVVPMAAGLAACSRRASAGYRGYAFIANQDGHAVAAVDLEAFAVARHIALDAAPAQVVAAKSRPSVYALAPAEGTLYDIRADRLSLRRKLSTGPAVVMRLDSQERWMYVLTREPASLARVNLDSWRIESRIALAGAPGDFALTADGKVAAVSLGSSVCMIDLESQKMTAPLGEGEFGAVCFLSDSRTMIAADRGARRLSLYEVQSARLITHLPLAVRPDNLCFNSDGGQLFITGEGLDAVVIVYPFHTPEVGQTVLAGHAPGPMAASDQFLFIASPRSGDVTVFNIGLQKVIGVVSVGSDPGCVVVTPDDQYALVLNRASGDVAVLRVGKMQAKLKSAVLLTVIPVGSRPVSAAVRSV